MTLVKAITIFWFVNPVAIDKAIDKLGAREQRHKLDDLPAAHPFQLFDPLNIVSSHFS